MKQFVAVLLVAVGLAQGARAEPPTAASQPLEKLTGLVKPANWQDLAPWQDTFYVSETQLPQFYDWRFYAQGLSPIRFQQCGDCWAQGTVGVLESLIKIKTGQVQQMSVQEIISCSGDGSCNGGYFAHDYHVSHGGSTEAAYPYQGRNTRCASKTPSEYLATWGYVGTKGGTPTTAQIKQAMMDHGPIAVTVYANNAMQGFKGDGVFTGCSDAETNHIVVLVGWDDTVKTPNGNGVWFMRNSWGTSWGDQGYAKVPFGCSNIGEAATWADLKVSGQYEDGPITPYMFQ